MKSNRLKAGRLKMGGILLILSGAVGMLAGVLGKQPLFSGVGTPFLIVGLCLIAQSKRSTTP